MINKLHEYLREKNGSNFGIKTIRPKSLLEFAEASFNKPIEFVLNIPSSGIGSLTMLEAMLVNALLKICNPRNIFEFGTFLGYTTHSLAVNSNKEAKVYSLDLGPNFEKSHISMKDVLTSDLANDNYLRSRQSSEGAYFLSAIDTNTCSKIKLIHCNSLELDIDLHNLRGKIDFFFIDGGHTFEIIDNDTTLSLSMSSNPSIIIWHDYNSKIHGDVTTYLQSRSKNSTIYHVENSMIAFELLC